MARIKLNDLPLLEELTPAQMKDIFGGAHVPRAEHRVGREPLLARGERVLGGARMPREMLRPEPGMGRAQKM